jgi:hypothetical protein
MIMSILVKNKDCVFGVSTKIKLTANIHTKENYRVSLYIYLSKAKLFFCFK